MSEELKELIAVLGAETVVRILRAAAAGQLTPPGDLEEPDVVDDPWWWERPDTAPGMIEGAPTVNINLRRS